MSIPTQIENQIANDLALLIIDRVRSYAHRRAVALKRKAGTTADKSDREELTREAEKFDDLSKTFGALTDPDALPSVPS